MRVKLLVLALISIPLGGCRLPPDTEVRLGVPYRAQEQFNYCVPACVLMWRLYDRLGEVSQTSIWNWMGGFPGCATPNRAAAAVAHFTNTFDAYADGEVPSNYKSIIARQITSIDQGTPVMAVIHFDHVVVVDGGKWHDEGLNHMWDFIDYNDPDAFEGQVRHLSAAEWIRLFCDPAKGDNCFQIISANATSNWEANFAHYSADVYVYGVSNPDNNN